MVRSFLDEWHTVQSNELSNLKSRVRSLTLVTGTLFGPVLEKAAAELTAASGLQISVKPIINTKLGEGITVAGLVMAENVITSFHANCDPTPLPLFPRILFPH